MCYNDHILQNRNKLDVDFIDRAIALTDDEFCRLAAIRLNVPLSKNHTKEHGIVDEGREYWTEEYLRGVVHENCHGKWTSLGFEIVCSCKCDHKKNALALTEVELSLIHI